MMAMDILMLAVLGSIAAVTVIGVVCEIRDAVTSKAFKPDNDKTDIPKEVGATIIGAVKAHLVDVWASTKKTAPEIFGKICVATRKTIELVRNAVRRGWRVVKPYILRAIRWTVAMMVYGCVYILVFTKYVAVYEWKLMCKYVPKVGRLTWKYIHAGLNFVFTPIANYIHSRVAKIRGWFARWHMVIRY